MSLLLFQLNHVVYRGQMRFIFLSIYGGSDGSSGSGSGLMTKNHYFMKNLDLWFLFYLTLSHVMAKTGFWALLVNGLLIFNCYYSGPHNNR